MSSLTPDPENARAHDARNLSVIAESLKKYGQQTPLVISPEGVVLKGNATLQAAINLGWDQIAAIRFDKAAELVRGYKLVDNRSAELATWAIEVLKDELKKFGDEGGSAAAIGWSAEDLTALEEGVPERLESDATMLNRVGFIAGDPKTKVERFQKIELGQHILICADPIKDVGSWLEFVKSEDLFCPYPGPYIALALSGQKRRMILVQPDPFIAGYIVDRYQEIEGNDAKDRRKLES